MAEAAASFEPRAAISKPIVRRLLTIGEDRLERLTVEGQEGCECLLHAFLLVRGVAASGLGAGHAFASAIGVGRWADSPVVVRRTMTGFDGAAGLRLYRPLAKRLRNRQTFSATLDQLRKDRACLAGSLA